jgi:hypothetical protein
MTRLAVAAKNNFFSGSTPVRRIESTILAKERSILTGNRIA